MTDEQLQKAQEIKSKISHLRGHLNEIQRRQGDGYKEHLFDYGEDEKGNMRLKVDFMPMLPAALEAAYYQNLEAVISKLEVEFTEL